MKKSLSILLAFALVFSAFASVVGAQEEPVDIGAKLNAAGVIKGDGTSLKENEQWDRQDIAVLMSRFRNAEAEAQATPKGHKFSDIEDGAYYDGFITWAVDNGYMQGHYPWHFGYNEKVTNQQFAMVMLRALGYGDTPYDDALTTAIDLGLFAEGTDPDAQPVRGEFFPVIDATLLSETADGEILGVSLGLEGYEEVEEEEPPVEFAASAAQTGANKISVVFTTPAADDVTVAVKSGFLTADGTVTFNEDRTAATFEASNNFNAGTLTIEVSGLEPIQVATVAPVLTSFDIVTDSVKAVASPKLAVRSLNQFNEEFVPVAGTYQVNAFNITAGADANGSYNNGEITIAGAVAAEQKLIVTLVERATAKSVTKEYTVLPAPEISSIQLGNVAPLANQARIFYGNSDLVLPVTLIDQYGDPIALTAPGAGPQGLIEGVTFFTSNATIIDPDDMEIVTTAGGEVQFQFDVNNVPNAPATDVTISALVQKTSQLATTSVSINPAAALQSVTLTQPQGLFVAGEPITIPYQAISTYGDAMNLDLGTPNLVFFSNNAAVDDRPAPAGDLAVDGNGVFTITPNQAGVATVNLYYNGVLQGSIVLDVKAAAVPSKITGISANAFTNIALGATHTYSVSDFTIVDQYNRVMDPADLGGALTITKKDADATNVDIDNDVEVTALAAGSEVLTATYAGIAAGLDFTVTALTDSQVVDYVVNVPTNTTIYSHNSVDEDSDHAFVIELQHGVTADGKKVAVQQGFDSIISTNTTDFTIDVDGGVPTGIIYSANGQNDKTTVIIVVKKAKQVAQVTLTTSTAAPEPTSLTFVEIPAAIPDNHNFLTSNLRITDQYGVAFAPATSVPGPATGTFFSSDSSILEVTADGVATIVAGAAGTYDVTITYVTGNAKIATVDVKVTR